MNFKQIIESTNGKQFNITFTKADGTERTMIARTGVHKHLKGGRSTYETNPKNVGVYESLRGKAGRFEKGQYRCFNLDRIKQVKVDGQTYSI